jgi:hypothetical protein
VQFLAGVKMNISQSRIRARVERGEKVSGDWVYATEKDFPEPLLELIMEDISCFGERRGIAWANDKAWEWEVVSMYPKIKG